MIQKLINFLNRIILSLEKKQLGYSIEISDIRRDEDLTQLQELWKAYQARGTNSYDELMNACIFSSINNRDIQFLSKNYGISKNKNEKNLFGRLLSMTIIEFLGDINNLLGNNLRNELIKNGYQEFVDELKLINKEFSSIKSKHNKELRKIRNNASAHKTKNAKDLIDFTQNFEMKNIISIAIDVMTINNQLTRLSTRIINKNSEEAKKLIEKMKTPYNNAHIP